MYGHGMSDDSDYHKTVNGEVYEKWLHKACQVVKAKAGNRKAVLVIDNAPYHCETIEKLPTSNSNKQQIIDYLAKHGVSSDTSFSKQDLLALLSSYYKSQGGREKLRVYKVDKLAAGYGVEILRLPPYHCTLNPIEFFWGWLKTKISKAAKSTDKLSHFRDLAQQYISEMTSEMGKSFYSHAETVGKEFVTRDRLVFVDPQQFSFVLDSSDDESSVSSDSDDSVLDLMLDQDEEDRLLSAIRSKNK